jgi:hypothetical protein
MAGKGQTTINRSLKRGELEKKPWDNIRFSKPSFSAAALLAYGYHSEEEEVGKVLDILLGHP